MSREIKTYFKKEEPKDSGDILVGYSKRVCVEDESNDYQSYIEADVKIVVQNNGALSFQSCDSNDFIYFYPDQLLHLKEALDVALKQLSKNF